MIQGIIAGEELLSPGELGGERDPYWRYVNTLLYGEGADGSQSFTDHSQYGRTLTPQGAVENDTDADVAGIPSIRHRDHANAILREYAPEINMAYNTPDFCFECFFMPIGFPGRHDILTRRYNSGQYSWTVYNGGMNFNYWNGTSGYTPLSVAHTMVNGGVYHICVIRIGTTLYGFQDGVLLGSNNYNSNTISQNTTPIHIGRGDSNLDRYNRGSINHLRLTIGHSRYDPAGFDVPAVPFLEGFDNSAKVAAPDPAFANVQYLIGFDGADGATTDTDDSANNFALTFNGNAQLDDNVVKFGSTSLALDGNGDWVELPDSALQSVAGGQDFCVEAWIRLNTLAGDQCVVNKRDNTNPDEYQLYVDDGILTWDTQASTNVLTSSMRAARYPLAINTWYHVAVSRDGDTLRMFINGNLACVSGFYGGISTTARGTMIGAAGDSSRGTKYFNGNISEVRFTRGEPVYTVPFNPPTGPFPRA